MKSRSVLPLLFIVWFGFPADCAGQSYAVIAPRTLRPHSAYDAVVVNVAPETQHFRCEIVDGDNHVVRSTAISVPSKGMEKASLNIGQLDRPGNYRLELWDGDKNVRLNGTSLEYVGRSYTVLFQTDKSIYNPGNTIRFRVVFLSPDLLPVVAGVNCSVSITDLDDVEIIRWSEVKLQSGVFEGSFALDSDRQWTFGMWTINGLINGQVGKERFYVEEHSVPPFIVDLQSTPNPYFYCGQKEMVLKLTASYPAGDPLQGNATVVVRANYNNYPSQTKEVQRKQFGFTGTARVVFPMPIVAPDCQEERTVWFDVTVRDGVTGRIENVTRTFTVHQTLFTMEVLDGANNFHPGLAMQLKVRLASIDGKPLDRKSVAILYTLQEENHEAEPVVSTVRYLTNSRGIIRLFINTTLDTVAVNVDGIYLNHTFSLVAADPMYENNAIDYLTAHTDRAFYTPHQEVTVFVRSNFMFQRLFFVCFCRGWIVCHHGVVESERAQKQHRLKFQASPLMVHHTKVLMFTIQPDGRISSTAVRVHFRPMSSSALNLTTSPTGRDPHEYRISVSAPAGAFVGLLGVDVRAKLVSPIENDLTSKKLDKALQSPKPIYDGLFLYNSFRSVGAELLTNGYIQDVGSVPHSFMRDSISPTEDSTDGSHFPDTWLWESFRTTTSSPNVTIDKRLPGTIGTYSLTAFSVDPTNGLQFSKPIQIQSTKRVFAELRVPDAMIVGEKTIAHCLVHNDGPQITITVDVRPRMQNFTFLLGEGATESLPVELRMDRPGILLVEVVVRNTDGDVIDSVKQSVAVHSVAKHYSIVGAKIIRPNSEYRVVVTTFDVTETIQFRVSIAAQDNILATENVTLSNNESRVISLPIGNIPVNRYELVAEGLSGIVFKKKVDLQYDNKFCSVLIQTDKSIYKPGDTVRYRVLLLDRNMKPSLNESSMIYITDGQSNRIKQWTNVDLGGVGVFEGELPLSTEPVLGTWNINVEVLGVKQLKPFDVDEYVLPTFDVTVKSSGYTTVEDESLLVTVNAKYTYGKPVAGELTVTVKAQQQQHLFGNCTPTNLCQKVVQTDGKSVVEFHLRDELKLETMHIRDFLVEAEVREQLTGRTLRGSTDVKIHEDRYTVTLVEEKKYVPGLPYHASLKVANLDGSPVKEPSIIVLVRNGSKVQLKNYSLDVSGSISLDLNLDSMNFNYLRIEALYCGKSYELQGIQKPFEDKEAHLRVGAKDKEPVAGKDMELEAVNISLPSMCAMVPRTKVVVHYVSNAGSVISDNATVEFRNIFENHIQVDLSHETAKPGDAIDISVKAKEDSFVGLLAVDQSVLLLKSGNDITKKCFTKELEAYDTSSESSGGPFRRYYDRQSFPDFEDVGAVFIANPLVPKVSPNSMGGGQLFGCAAPAAMAFSAPGMMKMRMMACDMQMESAHVAVPEKEPTIRSNFPETWIWESIQKCKGDGERIRKIVPDTVTSWIISGFSLSKTYGLGLMEAPAKMSVFLPFFISIDLPYSVKHGETVRIPVVVFNYLNEDQTADVIFFNKDQEFEFVSDDSESRIHEEHHRRLQVALPKDGGKTLSFTVKPKKVGHITLEITATCALAGDGIERELLVEPEGVPQYINKARLVDLRSESSVAQTFEIDIPGNAVPNSTKVEVSVIGDVLGSSIENLDSLIRMPFGCGEQNMLNFVPCIVVLDYLTACRRLTSELEVKAKKCMEVGYQRELTYKHADGSFSAFGQSDERGSTWLTAFVAKSFLQAAKYIGVEMPIVESALEWLSKVQTADGAFPEVGTICHKDMQGGAAGGLALTAYTVLAFLENRQLAAKYASTVDKAFTYIGQQVEKECDVYSYALVAYALQLADHKLKDGVMQKLESRATAEGDMKWWSKPLPKQEANKALECCWNRPCSVNVEMSAYALLASLLTSSGLEGLPIMKWLISQRNDKGGFQSTQDTVVGLEALAKMAAKVSSSESDVTVTVKAADDVERSLTVNQENALVLQKHQLPETVSAITMTANGTGCALFQLSYKYNIKDVVSSPRFTLLPLARKGKLESCIDLSVRTSFVPTADQPVSNMAVMEVDMPSGFVVEQDSLKPLKEGTVVKKIETKRGDTTVVLYFDNIGVTCVEVTLAAFRKHEVTNAKPANVIIYDYYDNTRCARSFYEVAA
ncbi:CD109 antigen-like [Anopheles bellator]|uniref:CD109 antigen-like n=1 Tax=Anopheles bellator TaxID=139047 RepID=UPI002649D498|nr:CD109 antigen-like [Anopheles bellator]